MNFYSCILYLLGVGIGALPLFGISKCLFVLQIGVAIICLKETCTIFPSWKDKTQISYSDVTKLQGV